MAVKTPRLATQITTSSPQKHHTKTPVFRKTLCKNALSPQNKKISLKNKKRTVRQSPDRPFFNLTYTVA